MSGSGWQRWVGRTARSVERRVDEAKARFIPRAPRHIMAYRGFGSRTEVFVTGRVLASAPPQVPHAGDAWWQNLAASLRHLESDEVRGARLRIQFAGAQDEALTDDEGYYRAWLKPGVALDDSIWHRADIEVIDSIVSAPHPVRTSGRILVPDEHAEFAVISDLDDTVLRTDVTRLFIMLKRTLLENARMRLPFAGVPEFYEALHRGDGGRARNPIFYVSSSPWNLYSPLTEFLEHYSIPDGPLMLRDWGLNGGGLLPGGHGAHKLSAIRLIMNCYPRLRFILIGDSGQEDPEIYRDVVHEYGDRVLAVYIRNVTTDPARARAVGELAEEVSAAGSELRMSDDTLSGAVHAAERGWITRAAVQRVERAVTASGARPG